MPSTPLAERFWSKVAKSDGCWQWTATLSTSGYGKIGVGPHGAGVLHAHRVSWELHFGPIPDGLWVLHHCDNRPCVRPDHLFLGTVIDNMQDAVGKGRIPSGDRHHSRRRPDRLARGDRNGARTHPEALRRGVSHPQAKLRSDQVAEIRSLCESRTSSQAQIGARFGVSQSLVSLIARGEIWLDQHLVKQQEQLLA